jgi:hypothetical protein
VVEQRVVEVEDHCANGGRHRSRLSPDLSCVGLLADDDSPGSDGPRGDQTLANIRIVAGEPLDDGAIVRPPNEDRSVRRFGNGTCEDQVPTSMGFPSKRQMRLSQGGPTSQVVIDQYVLQQVVAHGESVE